MTVVQSSAPKLDPREQYYWIESPRHGMRLFLRYLPPARRDGDVRPILYVHGATFPSALSIAHRFDGYSWRDALCEAGFGVWGFDFHGYGHSDRYPAMNEPPQANPPLCRAEDASEQLEAVARFILQSHGVRSLSIMSHSWGSMPTARFAGRHPAMIERLVLFGAIARRPPRRYEWGERYLDSDPESRGREPAGVKIPTGPFTDILHAWHGELAYDPALVQAPVAIIRGEWDGLSDDANALAFRRFYGLAAQTRYQDRPGNSPDASRNDALRALPGEPRIPDG